MNRLNVFKDCFYKHPRFWLRNIKMFFRCIKWSYQRITRGYCDADLYSFDFYHTELITQALATFVDNHMSTALYLKDGTKIENDEEWVQYIMEIVKHFKTAQEFADYCEWPYNKQDDEDASAIADAEYSIGFSLLENAYRNLWD